MTAIIHDPASPFTLHPGIPYRVIEEHGELVVRPMSATGWCRTPTAIPGTKERRPAYQFVEINDPIFGLAGLVTREQIRKAWFRLAKVHDPKHGGDPAVYRRLRDARNRAYQQLRWQGVTRQPPGWRNVNSAAKISVNPNEQP